MTSLPLERWEGEAADALAARWGVPGVRLFATVGSTNDEARRLAAQGAPSGTVVLAERQVAGRGRAGRGWDSPAGLGLWLSVILRPGGAGLAGTAPLRIGLAVARGLDPFLGAGAARLKWPNDLQAGGRKLGGILCEGVWEPGGLAYLVAGVGLNVLHAPADFPPEIREGATSVRIAAGREPSRREVASAVVPALGALVGDPLELSPGDLAELEARDALRGRRVTVREPVSGAPLAEGTALGVSAEGALLLRTPAGVLREVRSGTVRLAD